MRRPPGAERVESSAIRATLAVASGSRTIRQVGERCGWASSSTALLALRKARTARLVDWTDKSPGTLHAKVQLVRVDR